MVVLVVVCWRCRAGEEENLVTRKKAGMKIGHEAAALDLITSAITTRRCVWKAKADIDLLPSTISNIQLLRS